MNKFYGCLRDGYIEIHSYNINETLDFNGANLIIVPFESEDFITAKTYIDRTLQEAVGSVLELNKWRYIIQKENKNE